MSQILKKIAIVGALIALVTVFLFYKRSKRPVLKNEKEVKENTITTANRRNSDFVVDATQRKGMLELKMFPTKEDMKKFHLFLMEQKDFKAEESMDKSRNTLSNGKIVHYYFCHGTLSISVRTMKAMSEKCRTGKFNKYFGPLTHEKCLEIKQKIDSFNQHVVLIYDGHGLQSEITKDVYHPLIQVQSFTKDYVFVDFLNEINNFDNLTLIADCCTGGIETSWPGDLNIKKNKWDILVQKEMSFILYSTSYGETSPTNAGFGHFHSTYENIPNNKNSLYRIMQTQQDVMKTTPRCYYKEENGGWFQIRLVDGASLPLEKESFKTKPKIGIPFAEFAMLNLNVD